METIHGLFNTECTNATALHNGPIKTIQIIPPKEAEEN